MARDILELGADVVDDTIVESKHRISPKKRNYIIGLSITGLLLAGSIAFAITAANLWLQDMDYLENIQFYYTPKDSNNPNAAEPTLTLYKLDPNTKYPKSFRIPERVNGYKVTTIAPEAFNGHVEIEKIIFTKYVTNVGEKAFYGLKNLSEIKWNQSLSYIGADAFGDTAFYKNLEKDPKGFYRIPSGVLIYLGTDYFDDNTVLVDSSLSETERNNIKTKYGVSDDDFFDFNELKVVNFVSGLFKNNQKIVYIDLPSFLNDVGDKTFYNCSNLKGVSFLNSNVKTIKESAFQNCVKLKDITFSDALADIGDYAFANTAIEDIPALHNVKNMGVGIFQGCEHLETVIYPANETFTSVPEDMFADCTSLSTIYWGDTSNSAINYVDSFGIGAFKNTAFTEFVVPKNVPAILDKTFEGCSKLEKISLYNNPNYQIVEDSVTKDENGNLIYENSVLDGSYTFKDNQLTIKVSGRSDIIANVETDGSLIVTIDNLDGSYGTDTVTFNLTSAQVTSLSNKEELYITGDKQIYQLNLSAGYAGLLVPMNYYVRNDGVFGPGSLVGVRDIRSKAFNDCELLSTMAIYDDDYNELPGCDVGTFTFPQTLRTTHNDSYNINSNYTFAYTSASTVKVSSNVRSIGSYGFANSMTLSSVEFGTGSILKSVGNYAFLNDTALASISLPDGVTSLGSGVFSGCTGLTTAEFANTQIKTVGAELFYNCSSLTSVSLPNTVTAIQKSAFRGANSLQYVIIPSSVTQILESVFVDNLHQDETRLPVYFHKTYGKIDQINLNKNYMDEKGAYPSYLLGDGEEKLPGLSYWNGNDATPTEILLTDLAYTGTLEKTEYNANEAFNPNGLTITASYDDGQPVVLNGEKDVKWNALAAGDTSVTGTYMVGNVIKTITVNGITVN